MFSNNKNKKSKELTLQQIIQKSTFRKTIDNLCLLEKKINNDPSKLSSLNSTPIGSFAKISKQFNKIQLLPQKKTYQSTKLTQKLTKNQITARTTRSQKITTTNFNQVMSIANQYQTIQHKQSQILLRKIKENHCRKIMQQKVKLKNHQIIFVQKGDPEKSQIVLNLQLRIQISVDQFLNINLRNIKLLFSQGNNCHRMIMKNLKFQSQQDIKKFHSFMLTKYSTSNGLRQRSSSNKSYSHSKFKQNILLTEQLIQKKNDYKGIKTQQKSLQSKLQNEETISPQKSKRLKKYQLILNVNTQDENDENKKSTKLKLNSKIKKIQKIKLIK